MAKTYFPSHEDVYTVPVPHDWVELFEINVITENNRYDKINSIGYTFSARIAKLVNDKFGDTPQLTGITVKNLYPMVSGTCQLIHFIFDLQGYIHTQPFKVRGHSYIHDALIEMNAVSDAVLIQQKFVCMVRSKSKELLTLLCIEHPEWMVSREINPNIQTMLDQDIATAG